MRAFSSALQPLADLEGDLGPAAIDGDRAAVRAQQSMLGLEDHEVLADGHGRDPEARGQLVDADATVLLDDAGDVLLPLAGEDVAGGGAGWIGHASPYRDPAGRRTGFRLVVGGTVDSNRTQCQEGN